jgi:hypothetical protein
MVADGHLTDIPLESVYSGVVSLRGLQTLLFIAELNDLQTWTKDVGNSYLEAETKEKVYVIAGSQFGDLEGHVLIIIKALYGLHFWHERFADCLREMDFFQSKSEADIWMQKRNDKYEFFGVYVDDLAIIAHDPKEITDILVNKYK